jgi:hypothetical protein
VEFWISHALGPPAASPQRLYKSRSDIANTAVRIFLQDMGKEYGYEAVGKAYVNGWLAAIKRGKPSCPALRSAAIVRAGAEPDHPIGRSGPFARRGIAERSAAPAFPCQTYLRFP